MSIEEELKKAQGLVVCQQYLIESLQNVKSIKKERVIICYRCQTDDRCTLHRGFFGDKKFQKYAKHNMSLDEVIRRYAFWARELFNNRNPFKKEYFTLPIDPDIYYLLWDREKTDIVNNDNVIENVCGIINIIISLENFDIESGIQDYINIVKANILTMDKKFVDTSDDL